MMALETDTRHAPCGLALGYQSVLRSRRRQMMALPRVTNASWMSSRTSQRMRRRWDWCGSVSAPSTTQWWMPRPESCPVPCRAMRGVISNRRALVPVDVMVVAAVGVQVPRPIRRSAAFGAGRRDGLDQRDQLGDAVMVAIRGDRGQWDAVGRDDDVMLAAGLASLHRPPGTGRWPTRPSSLGCGWNPSRRGRGRAVRQHATRPAAARAASAIPRALFQSRSRLQQVIPDPNPSSCGRNSQRIPV
jgi:hypothetical protein